MNRKCVSALPLLSHLHSQTEIAGFGAAIIFASLLLALPVRPLSFQSRGELKLLHVTHSGEREKKKGWAGGRELHYTTKVEWHGSRMRCISRCLITVELFKIEAAAAAEYF